MARIGDRWFAWLLGKVSAHHDRLLEDRKRRLFEGLSGTVVEIGPGTGVNLPYYSQDVRWIGIEPNPFMHMKTAGGELRLGFAEKTGMPDTSVDAVVCTLVLCSVADPAQCLTEIRRILKPGGRFLFVEHVAAPRGSMLHRMQRLIKPLWGFAGGGCDPARHTAEVLMRAGFSHVQMEEFRLPLSIVAPHIMGVAFR